MPILEVDPPASVLDVPVLEVELPNPVPVEIGLPNPVLLLEFEPPTPPVLVPAVELPTPVVVPEIESPDVPLPALFWAETGRARGSTAKLNVTALTPTTLAASKFIN
ncbi:MAG: hypothetical protein JO235_13205 [Chroococcidiopsidaceae cyanobacterium CP_BM_RX_35]|nr:hypothetical protein [Chroococcidiopsidaceae cyanobacterium CP_BM_RX_35]